MKRNWFLFMLVMLLTLGLITACGGGGDDDDDDATPGDDDDDIIDDDDDDDDTSDDDTGDDDTGDDDTGDDDTGDDDINDYDPLTCTPDAGIWGEDLPITGSEITDTIDVVVIDDMTCDPIEGAMVYSGDSKAEVETDENGAAQFTGESGATLVTAAAEGYWARSFLVNADTILFRLRPDASITPYYDSPSADFYLDDASLNVDQANFGLLGIGLIQHQVYAGAALQGISRQNALQIDFENLFTDSVFEGALTIDVLGLDETFELPENVYIPKVDGSGDPGLDHPSFKVRESPLMDEMALMGLVLRLRTNELGLPGILNLIEVIGTGNFDAIDRDLIADLQSIAYAGIMPEYTTGGTPDIDVYEVNDQDAGSKLTSPITRSGSLAGDNDYLSIMIAEVANRSLVPLSISHLNDGSMNMDYAEIPDARYYVMTAATNMLTEEEQNISLSVTPVADPAAGADVDGFVPYFEDVDYSAWESTCTVSWTLPSKANMTPNLITLIIFFTQGGHLLFVDLPATETSYTVPASLGWTCRTLDQEEEYFDVIGVIASYSPDLDVNERDYNTLLADVEGASVNVSYDLISGLFPSY